MRIKKKKKGAKYIKQILISRWRSFKFHPRAQPWFQECTECKNPMKKNYTRMLPWYYVFKVTKTAVILIQNDRTDFWEASSTVFPFPPILERARSTTTYYITDLYPPLAMFHYFIISHIYVHTEFRFLLSTVHTVTSHANLLINFPNMYLDIPRRNQSSNE